MRYELVEDAFRTDVNLNSSVAWKTGGDGPCRRACSSAARSKGLVRRDAWVYGIGVSNGYDVTKDSFVLTNLSASGRYAESGENQAVGASARYYLCHGRHVVYQRRLLGRWCGQSRRARSAGDRR